MDDNGASADDVYNGDVSEHNWGVSLEISDEPAARINFPPCSSNLQGFSILTPIAEESAPEPTQQQIQQPTHGPPPTFTPIVHGHQRLHAPFTPSPLRQVTFPGVVNPSMMPVSRTTPILRRTLFTQQHVENHLMTPNQAQGGYMALMQAALNCHQFRDVGQPLHHFPIFVTRDATGVAKFPPYIIQRPANAPGVLQVSGHPFDVKANDVFMVIGDDTIIVHYVPGIPAIHICQDRMMGKTAKMFVECVDIKEARRVTSNLKARRLANRNTKFGVRHGKVDLASETDLMKALFPKAKCAWNGAIPVRNAAFLKHTPGPFAGFITTEELRKVAMYSQHPFAVCTRAAHEYPDRVYTFMISALTKIPWNAQPKAEWFPDPWVSNIRETLYAMAIKLVHMIRFGQHPRLDLKLLIQFMNTLRACPLFATTQIGVEIYADMAQRVEDILAGRPHTGSLGPWGSRMATPFLPSFLSTLQR